MVNVRWLGAVVVFCQLSLAQDQLVQSFALNGYKRFLDGQWEGIRYASDGNVYFGSSTHSAHHGASFFKYNTLTNQVTLLAEDITVICGEDPQTNPQGKLHSDMVEANGWLYFSTHFSSEHPSAYATWSGSHVIGYQLATGVFRDYGVVHPNYTSYSAIGVDRTRNYLYVFVTGQNLGQVSYLYRIDTVTGTKTNLGQVGGAFNSSFWTFVDQRGDVWFSVAAQNGDLHRVRAASGVIDTFPNALPPLYRWDSEQLATATEQQRRWIMWMQPLDGDRAVFNLGWNGGMLYLFDSSKPIGSGQEFKNLKHIGFTDVGLALGANRVFYYQRANRQLGNQEYRDFHLMSVSLDEPSGYPITDHGLLKDQDGRVAWRLPGMMTDGGNRVFMIGDWWTIAGDLGTLRYNYNNGVESYNQLPRGEFFAVANIDPNPPPGPLSISSLTVSGLTPNAATVSWNTNHAASEQVFYGTSLSYGLSTPLVNANASAHSAALAGLAPDTLYYFKAVSGDGTSTSEAASTFRTPNSALTISNAQAASITRTSAAIQWSTNRGANGQVFYGTTPALGSQTILNSAVLTSHSEALANLQPDTTYYFSVVSSEPGGAPVRVDGLTFRTNPAAVTITGAQTSATADSATVTWNTSLAATDVVTYGTTLSYRSGSFASNAPATGHSVTIPGLVPLTTYYVRIVSTDAFGGTATVEGLSFRTLQTPLQITELTVYAINNTSAIVSWRTSRAAGVQLLYGATTQYGSAVNLPTPRTSSYTQLTGLSSGTTYHLKLIASDGGTPAERTASFTTTGGAAALTVSGVQPASVTQTSAVIGWITNVPATSRVEYGTTAGLGSATPLDSTLLSNHAVALSGLTAATTYFFRVLSTDAQNRSAASPVANFTTASAAPALQMGTPQVGNITANGASITFTTTIPARGQILYGTSPTALTQTTPLETSPGANHTFLLSGLLPGITYYFRATATDGIVSVSSSVLTFNTAPASATYTLGVTPLTVTAGGNVTLTWSAPANHSRTDWIGLYLVGASNREYRWYLFTGTATSGSATVRIPAAGQYEFRYLVNNTYTDAARSATITALP